MKQPMLCTILISLLLTTNARAEDMLQKVKRSLEREYHYIQDVLVDPEGYIHVIDMYAPPPMIDEHALWYTKLDREGEIVASQRIPHSEFPSNVALKRRPTGTVFGIFYESYTIRYVGFTPHGTIAAHTEISSIDGWSDSFFDKEGQLLVLLSGWELSSVDEKGNARKITSLRGYHPFGGFVNYYCHKLSGDRILVLNHVWDNTAPRYVRYLPVIPKRLRFMIIDRALEIVRSPREIDVSQFADPPVSEIYFSRPQVFNATDGGAFVYLSSMKGSRVETYRIRFDKNGVLQKKPTANAKPLKAIEYSGGGVQLRLNKTIPYEPNPMEGTMLFGFDDDGNIQYVRSSVTFNVKKP